MIPPPPIPPLFPYTTLFRSRRAKNQQQQVPQFQPSSALALRHAQIADRWEIDLGRNASVQQVDRKSTRLNSSHQIISYAVFCLKKKNQTVTRRPHTTTASRT